MNSQQSVPRNVSYGDREMALGNEILRSVVGSGVHGIAIAGTDDHDEMGVFIEPENVVLGLGKPANHYIWRTQPEGMRPGPGDTDLVMYSLRRYLRLAAKGNPTALLPLYAPPADVLVTSPLGEELRAMASAFLSTQAVERFLGYMNSQHRRMLGVGARGKVPNRPELVAAHGWDVKYGSHALRLAYQGREIAQQHTLTLPLATAERERVLSVKRGEVPRDEVSQEISQIESDLRDDLDAGRVGLPPEPDQARLSAFSVRAHQQHWRAVTSQVV